MSDRQAFKSEVKVGMIVLALLTVGLGASVYYRVNKIFSDEPQIVAQVSNSPDRLAPAETPLLAPVEGPQQSPTPDLPPETTGGSFLPSPPDTIAASRFTAPQSPAPTQPPAAFPVAPAANVEPQTEQFSAARADFIATQPQPNPPPSNAFTPAPQPERATPVTRLESTPPAAFQPSPSPTTASRSSPQLTPQPQPAAALPPARTLPNDSFWMISERAYGVGAYFKVLYHHNRSRFPHPDRLPVGEIVETPPVEELRRLYPEMCENLPESMLHEAKQPYRRRLYSVRPNDTLYEIARRELGEGRRWNEIYRLNQARLGDRYDNLPADMQLLLPE